MNKDCVQISRIFFLLLNPFKWFSLSNGHENLFQFFATFFQRFWSWLNVIEATHVWLWIGTSFTSLTRNYTKLEMNICLHINFGKVHIIPIISWRSNFWDVQSSRKPLFDYWYPYSQIESAEFFTAIITSERSERSSY